MANETLQQEKKYVRFDEVLMYLAATFVFTAIQGMTYNYRNAYLVNVLGVSDGQMSFIASFFTLTNFVIGFFVMMKLDQPPKLGKNKFKPFVKLWTIPAAISLVLMFYTPEFITKNNAILMVYCLIIPAIYCLATNFLTSINNLAMVITPNSKERDNIISYRSILNAIGNSAPLVVVLVIAIFIKTEAAQYLVSAIVVAIISAVFLLAASKKTKERTVYNCEKSNPLSGYAVVLKNKYAVILFISEFLGGFKRISTALGIFFAAALLGSTSQYILLGLPTGIGTFVGMLLVNFFLKKFNGKQIYIVSGIYSLIINTTAYFVGSAYFRTENPTLQIVFIFTLFLIGLQFGATNVLPFMFQADILEDIEVKTHKRVEATLSFLYLSGYSISGIIADYIWPKILYGENSLIGYIQPIGDTYFSQSLETKIAMLFWFTVSQGIAICLSTVPYLFYDLVGDKKDQVHQKALEYRQELEKSTNQ